MIGLNSKPTRSGGPTAEFAFVVVALAMTWLGNEFESSGGVSPWFQQTQWGVPAQFVLFFLLLALLAPYVVSTPAFAMAAHMRNIGLFHLSILAWSVIGFAIAIALVRGAPELFADWRNLLITTITAIVAAKFLAAQEWKGSVVTDLAIAYGLLAIPTLLAYAAGSGQTVLGVRTTVFDAATLYTACFATITATWHYLNPVPSHTRLRKAALYVAGIAASLLVLLSFRRSFWLCWVVGVAAVVILTLRSRERRGVRLYGALLVLCLLVATATVALGTEALAARIESFLPGSAGEFSATNEDHVNDIIDAWRVVAQDPLLGLGIGSHYETNLIADWKTESFEVHNAVLHVWLKFGIVGAAVYLAFHFGLIRAALRNWALVPIAAFFVGELAATAFGTWPYGSFQMSVFHGLLIAVLTVNSGWGAETALSQNPVPRAMAGNPA